MKLKGVKARVSCMSWPDYRIIRTALCGTDNVRCCLVGAAQDFSAESYVFFVPYLYALCLARVRVQLLVQLTMDIITSTNGNVIIEAGVVLTPETVPLRTGPPTKEELLVYYPAKFTWKQLKVFVNSG